MKLRNSVRKYGPVAGVLAALGASSAHAALPAVVGTEIATMQTDALAAIDLVWPLIMAIIGGFMVIKIVKRASGKV